MRIKSGSMIRHRRGRKRWPRAIANLPFRAQAASHTRLRELLRDSLGREEEERVVVHGVDERRIPVEIELGDRGLKAIEERAARPERSQTRLALARSLELDVEEHDVRRLAVSIEGREDEDLPAIVLPVPKEDLSMLENGPLVSADDGLRVSARRHSRDAAELPHESDARRRRRIPERVESLDVVDRDTVDRAHEMLERGDEDAVALKNAVAREPFLLEDLPKDSRRARAVASRDADRHRLRLVLDRIDRTRKLEDRAREAREIALDETDARAE